MCHFYVLHLHCKFAIQNEIKILIAVNYAGVAQSDFGPNFSDSEFRPTL